MNTLPLVITAGTLLQYVMTDTTLICTAAVISHQLQLIHSWIVDSEMELNSKNSCVMRFQSCHCRRSVEHPDIVVNNMTLQTTVKKYLGLIYDNRLTWANHVSNTSVKRCHTIFIWLVCTGVFFLLV